mmetsp:Transcript_25260/g.57348  ORF Transcript_25260/g.57348 Transcript_25260/m.57348 type:complete len:101 (-) Transcript_25260:1807-2109(-)
MCQCIAPSWGKIDPQRGRQAAQHIWLQGKSTSFRLSTGPGTAMSSHPDPEQESRLTWTRSGPCGCLSPICWARILVEDIQVSEEIGSSNSTIELSYIDFA